ncbi:MAG: hypothetical protein WH035_05370, partial [Spirochaetota bacterium]
MNKSKIKKNSGLKKSILFLSILPLKYQKKVLSHLSISEQNKIVKLVEKFGGFSQIKNMIDINKYKFFNKELKRLLDKKEDKNGLDLFLSIILFIMGFLILVISIFKSSFENFIINFITTGYSNIFGPLLLLILVLNKKFNWDTNFTNLKSILRHLAEGLGCSILLIILLLQINAFYPQVGEKETDFLFLISTSFFIPFFEAISTTIILATDPIMVRFPAKVDDMAAVIQYSYPLLIVFRKGANSITAGTLETTLLKTAIEIENENISTNIKFLKMLYNLSPTPV